MSVRHNSTDTRALSAETQLRVCEEKRPQRSWNWQIRPLLPALPTLAIRQELNKVHSARNCIQFNLTVTQCTWGPDDCTLDSSYLTVVRERRLVSSTESVYPKLMGRDQKESVLTSTHLLQKLDTADHVPKLSRRRLNVPPVQRQRDSMTNPGPPPIKTRDPVIETTIQE